MSRPQKLSEKEIHERLPALGGWIYVDGALKRSFKFADFNAAWGFLSRVALHAESMNHHPDWSNVYSSVSVALNTHDAGGVTELDFELARRINRCL